MEKLQILFPEPQLRRLRGIAKRQDRPVSELVRNAVDLWLSRQGSGPIDSVSETPPVYNCGKISVDADRLRDYAYGERHRR